MERQELIDIYEETLSRLSGDRLVEEALRRRAPIGPVRVMALGKAAASMWEGAERVLGPLSGIAVGPPGKAPVRRREGGAQGQPPAGTGPLSEFGADWVGTQHPAGAGGARPSGARFPATGPTSATPRGSGPGTGSSVEWITGDHPVPGQGSLRAGARLLAFARGMRPDETALVLLSGGASALVEALPPSISLDDLAQTTKALLSSGVPILAFNEVRKHLSLLKGGRLAVACGAGRIEVLTISDVFGDDPAVIGSGPFAPDPSTFEEALAVLKRVSQPIPGSVWRWLEEGAAGRVAETPTELENVETTILSGPLHLAQTAAAVARERGPGPVQRGAYEAVASETFLGGDVAEVAAHHLRTLQSHRGPARLLAYAAEPTLKLPPEPGAGGRSQHLALLLAPHLRGTGAAFLAAGSDGQDGVGDAAGAAVNGDTAALAAAKGVDLEAALQAADSGTACRTLGVGLPSRATGTNLADLHLIALPPR